MARALLALLVVVLLVPAATARDGPDPRVSQEAAPCLEALEASEDAQNATCVVAYAHVTGWLLSAPLTTQRPPDDLPGGAYGGTSPTVTPFWDLDVFTFRFDGAGVEYRDGELRMHNQPLGTPVPLLTDQPIRLRVHFTAEQTELGAAEAPPPAQAGVIPCVTVEAHLKSRERTGADNPTSLATTSATGHLVRPGALAPQLPCADAGSYSIDEAGITSFDLALTPPPTLAADRHLTVEVRVYQEDAEGTRIGLHGVRLVQDPAHLNHLVIPVRDALRVAPVDTIWHEGRLYALTNVSSVWGQYDVDPRSLALEVRGPDGTPLQIDADLGDVRHFYTCHDCQDAPIRVVFDLDLLGARLPDGRFTVHVTAANIQGTAQAVGQGAFVLSGNGATLLTYEGDGGSPQRHPLRDDADAPFPALVSLVGLVGLVVVLRRR